MWVYKATSASETGIEILRTHERESNSKASVLAIVNGPKNDNTCINGLILVLVSGRGRSESEILCTIKTNVLRK